MHACTVIMEKSGKERGKGWQLLKVRLQQLQRPSAAPASTLSCGQHTLKSGRKGWGSGESWLSIFVVFSSFFGCESASGEKKLWFGVALAHHQKQAGCQVESAFQSPAQTGVHPSLCRAAWGCYTEQAEAWAALPQDTVQAASQYVTLQQSACFCGRTAAWLATLNAASHKLAHIVL